MISGQLPEVSSVVGAVMASSVVGSSVNFVEVSPGASGPHAEKIPQQMSNVLQTLLMKSAFPPLGSHEEIGEAVPKPFEELVPKRSQKEW